MVNVSVYIEGGVLPNDNVSAVTIDNSEKLREGFYMLLSQLVDPNHFNITVKLGGGNKQTVKIFKSKIVKEENISLLIDLDAPRKERENRLTELELTEYSLYVFFMIQEMEAWIISQIDKIDEYYKNKYIRQREGIALSEHHKIAGIHPENINKPSQVLKEILSQYYKTKNNKKKKYNKLKDGALLLGILDANELKETFEDFRNLISLIKKL